MHVIEYALYKIFNNRKCYVKIKYILIKIKKQKNYIFKYILLYTFSFVHTYKKYRTRNIYFY